jgi:SSS family solute:Na+ symporter
VKAIDWLVLAASLAFIVLYGLWKGRRNRDLDGYILADRGMPWYAIALSIMATQASAITFLSTPGQAYTDGMRFVQFYLGLPIAMVILSITAVPLYHRLRIYTAYEYLEGRFDLKTRELAALLFLVQRGLSTGITIYAPSLIVSVLLGWNIYATNLVIGVLVVLYTVVGGNKAVSWTHVHQMVIILGAMGVALVVAVRSLPPDVTFLDGVRVAGVMGRLNAIDFSFDLTNRYNFWSGLIGGGFVALSYFGTDQSQVQRYLTGHSAAESRLGLLFNGLVKVPMQFFILFVGAMVFVFYQFMTPPLVFNPVERARISAGRYAGEYSALEREHASLFLEKQQSVRTWLADRRRGNGEAESRQRLRALQAREGALRNRTSELLRRNDPGADTGETNYVFLTFVIRFLPAGLVGLVMAAIFAASMSSTAGGLSSLGATTMVDFYQRLVRPEASARHDVRMSRLFTLFWGLVSIAFAEFANRLGSLVEAVNILGSLFYGTILGIFLLAFYVRRVGGTAAFAGALVGEAAVVYCWLFTRISYLWYNVVGCLVGIGAAMAIEMLLPAPEERGADSASVAES